MNSVRRKPRALSKVPTGYELTNAITDADPITLARFCGREDAVKVKGILYVLARFRSRDTGWSHVGLETIEDRLGIGKSEKSAADGVGRIARPLTAAGVIVEFRSGRTVYRRVDVGRLKTLSPPSDDGDKFPPLAAGDDTERPAAADAGARRNGRDDPSVQTQMPAATGGLNRVGDKRTKNLPTKSTVGPPSSRTTDRTTQLSEDEGWGAVEVLLKECGVNTPFRTVRSVQSNHVPPSEVETFLQHVHDSADRDAFGPGLLVETLREMRPGDRPKIAFKMRPDAKRKEQHRRKTAADAERFSLERDYGWAVDEYRALLTENLPTDFPPGLRQTLPDSVGRSVDDERTRLALLRVAAELEAARRLPKRAASPVRSLVPRRTS